MTASDTMTTITRTTIILIALVQVILGVVFIAFPQQFAATLGLQPAPGWTDWIFAQFGARALGFAFGMWLVLRNPARHAGWIAAMIGVQVIDWIGTMLALATGKVTLANVATAPFLPVPFVVVLACELWRQRRCATTPTAR